VSEAVFVRRGCFVHNFAFVQITSVHAMSSKLSSSPIRQRKIKAMMTSGESRLVSFARRHFPREDNGRLLSSGRFRLREQWYLGEEYFVLEHVGTDGEPNGSLWYWYKGAVFDAVEGKGGVHGFIDACASVGPVVVRATNPTFRPLAVDRAVKMAAYPIFGYGIGVDLEELVRSGSIYPIEF
jgi:hypothetical protein